MAVSLALWSLFFRLPRETRDEIYAYAIPTTEMQVVGSGDASGVEFARGMGDPSGFYFRFRSNLGILAANRQMSKEALRLAYRKASIRLDDMDEFIKSAILIENIGRHNIESISFAWESQSYMESISHESLDSEHDCIGLLRLHSIRCVQLLGNFKKKKKKPKCVRLCFEYELCRVCNLTTSRTILASAILKPLENGANINTQYDWESTALNLAVLMGHEPTVRVLLQKRANVKLTGNSALHWAVARKGITRLLLEKDDIRIC